MKGSEVGKCHVTGQHHIVPLTGDIGDVNDAEALGGVL
jgi:hypothetical protein